MTSPHVQVVDVKSYLLGTMPEEQAAAVEERYFTDPVFFIVVRLVEIGLICQFLDGKLPEAEQEQFRCRYLQIPRLKQLVERFREERIECPIRKRSDSRG